MKDFINFMDPNKTFGTLSLISYPFRLDDA